MGKLIVIEGALDGIGKSTQFDMLKNKLNSLGVKTALHHFPTYDEEQGALVMEYLKGSFGKVSELSPYFVNSLYAIDRKITWEKKLKASYDSDNTVLLDRYTTSSLIYQSALIEDVAKKNEFLDYITDYEYNKLGIKKPDVVIFLFAPFDFIMELKKKRDLEKGEQIKGDIHENDLEFMKKVYKSAIYCAKYFDWIIIDCVKDNKFRSIEEIHQEICDKIL